VNSAICDLLGIDFPLLAFSHCRDVVAAVTNAGGFGVLGAAAYSPGQLDRELTWIDDHVDGRPYGADILVPVKVSGEGLTGSAVADLVPAGHRDFVSAILAEHGIESVPPATGGGSAVTLGSSSNNEDLLEVAFAHPIRLIANALGPPPDYMLRRARAAGIPVAALVGAREHAERQLAAGVDILVAQGTEAGGHCGEVSTLVLVPEVVEAAAALAEPGQRPVPVLAAGGIVTGRQMAAALALGAAGVWTGSVWLTTEEAETAPATRAKMLAATSRDTVRSASRTGKPSRQLRSAWTDAWHTAAAPATLPMPLQSVLSEPALRRVDQLAASGHPGAAELATYWVGQGVGLMNSVKPARQVVLDFMEELAASVEQVNAILGD
jgi:NAD(P)H-dependent flavin oxidoreductase YrpB (nitropropane dioxygenase family)